LLDHGAAIDSADRFQDTPFIMACAKGHRAIAQLLIERGADRTARNQQGRSGEDRAAKGLDVCRTPHTS
ncbi:MAG: ankyrin repeat domain-containing protein, partial [bacterium]|nr:ankyrin repeat domain-containing protein [bacterium]